MILPILGGLVIGYLASNKQSNSQSINSNVEAVPLELLNGIDYEPYNDEDDYNGLNRAVSTNEIYQKITDKMLRLIKEANASGYKKKWKGNIYGKGYLIPFNFDSKKRYRGVNHFLLTDIEKPLENPYFLTFKQIQKHKGTLKKGAKGNMVVYFTKLHVAEDKKRKLKFASYDLEKVETFAVKKNIPEKLITFIPILKYYNVFNGKDIEHIDFDLKHFKIGFIDNELPATKTMPVPEAIINHYPTPQPQLSNGGDRAFYSPGKDAIKVPYLVDFETAQDYYRTLFHEYAHSTGHETRLKRNFSGKFGSKKYAFEELIAEWGATFLSAEAGIMWHTNKNHAAYLKNWNSALTHIKDDNKFIMRACSQAQKLTDFVLQYNENGDPKYLKNLDEEIKKINSKGVKHKRSRKKPKKKTETGLSGKGGIEISTEMFRKMKVSELRKFTLDYYNQFLKGKKVNIKNHIKEVIFTSSAGRKISKGGPMYSEKAAVIESLEELIKNSTYNNWGNRKSNDKKEVLGYLNFKSKIIIDGIKRHLRISIILTNDRKKLVKSYDIGNKKNDSLPVGRKSLPTDEGSKPSNNKDTKTKPNSKRDSKKGLNAPLQLQDYPTYYIPKPTPNNVNATQKTPNATQNTILPEENPTVNSNATATAKKPIPSVKQTPKKTNVASNVLSSTDLMNMNFESMKFEGPWAKFMQDPAPNMRLAIWGKPKNGKTAGATQFAAYLTNFGSVLYNFADQGINKSTKDLWQLSGLNHKPNAYLTDTREITELDKLCASGNFDFVFIDMINTYIHRTGIKYYEFEDRFLKKYPHISFILIFEVTKTGNFKGDQGWTHLPDALITVDSFVMHNQGRYGVGDYVVWKEGLLKTNPKKYKAFFDQEKELDKNKSQLQQESGIVYSTF